MDSQSINTAVYDTIYFGYPLTDTPTPWQINVSPQATLDGLHEAFLGAAKEHLTDQPIILPLSGGLDSRLVLATLLKLVPAEQIHAYTYGLPGQLDFDIPPVIANATGIRHTAINLTTIDTDPTALAARQETLFATNAHNILGFHITQIATHSALLKMRLPSTAPIWSGFLGDRLFAGKWSSQHAATRQDIATYVSSFDSEAKRTLLPAHYDPLARLLEIYQHRPVSIEHIDLEQRQSRVRKTLQTTENPYVFLFETPNVINTLCGFNDADRLQSKLQRDYFHAFHPALAKLPVTSRFGYPLRQSQSREQLDRRIRLTLEKVGKQLNRQLTPFKRIKTTPSTLRSQLLGYEQCINQGMALAVENLPSFGINMASDTLATLNQNRSLLEQLSSLGYLIETKTEAHAQA